ncbi:MAG TPA: acyl carrier protein [Bdellovibrionales bacterium]|jgi:acyl carrier protein|nr:acyl carrier protein [Bdellovibrionales bacterium]
MSETEAFENLKSILSAVPDIKLRLPVSELRLDHSLKRDLGFDSIVLFSVFMELEGAFPHITEAEAAQWQTIGDCVQSMVRA